MMSLQDHCRLVYEVGGSGDEPREVGGTGYGHAELVEIYREGFGFGGNQ